MEMLYRGVDCQTDEGNAGKIRAKGNVEQLVFMAGNTSTMAGNSFNTVGISSRNAMHAHNICSDTYKTTYVSFTTDRKVAERFATIGGLADGYVYVVSARALDELGIEYSSQPAQINDKEHEVLVNLAGVDAIPASAIAEKILVKP
ncbi:hypothetical protein GQL56_09645 [Pseudomonas putida]|nr:hypothetical protein [Pseudomonas putida]